MSRRMLGLLKVAWNNKKRKEKKKQISQKMTKQKKVNQNLKKIQEKEKNCQACFG